MVTITAVRPLARFGELSINKNNEVMSFKEKPQTLEGWINGGFFVINSEFLKFIDNDNSILEKEPLENIVGINQLAAFKHSGFWQCMDTKRDRDKLEDIFRSKNVPWMKSVKI